MTLTLTPAVPDLGASTKLSLTPTGDEEEAPRLSLTPAATDDPSPKLDLTPAVPEGGADSDLAGAFGTGVRKSLAPFSMSAEELRKPRTTGESLAETAGQVGTDILTTVGASAAAGALAGSVVPGAGTAVGTAVGLGLGLYRALGYEDMMSKQKGEDFNPARAALNVAVEAFPMAHFGGRLAKFLGQGALSAAQSLSYGGGGTDALVAGIVGGSLGAATHTTVSPSEEKAAVVTSMITNPGMGPKATADLVNHLTDDGTRTLLMQQAVAKLPEHEFNPAFRELAKNNDFFTKMAEGTPIQEMADSMGTADLKALGVNTRLVNTMREALVAEGADTDAATLSRMARQQAVVVKLEDQATDLARMVARDSDLTGPELFKAAAEKLKATSLGMPEFMEAVKFQKALNATVSEEAERMVKRGTGLSDPADNTVFRKISDQKFVARASDRVTGLDLEPRFADVSRAKYGKDQFVFWAAKETDSLWKDAKKAGLDTSKIVSMLERPAEFHFTEDQGRVMEGFRSLMDNIRERGNSAGLDVGHLENYVTHVQQAPADFITSVRRRLRPFVNPDGSVSGRMFQDEELLGVMSQILGDKVRNKGDALRVLAMLDNPQGIKKLSQGFEASSAFSRGGPMPEFVRETDIRKVLLTYASNTANAVYLDPAVRQLEMRVHALRTLGQTQTAEWLTNQINAISGKKSGFLQWTSNAKVRWKTGIDEMLDTGAGLNKIQTGSLKIAKFAPDLFSWGLSQIYPNYLAFRVLPVVRNLTQPFATTAGEVGGGYGYKLASKASFKTMQSVKEMGLEGVQKHLESLGYHAGDHVTEALNMFHSELGKTLSGPIVKRADDVGRLGMWMYGKTETINRMTTLHMADEIVRDLKAGNPAAMKFLKKLPPGVSNDVLRDLKSGQDITGTLAKHLLSSTQFDYGPQAMSEFGQTFGRFVSMFTKWPTMVVGDLHDIAKTRDATKAMQKYLAPWAALGLMSMWLADTKDSPRRRALIGKSLLDYSPLSAVTGISAPPILQMGSSATDAFLKAVAFDFKGAAQEGLKTVAPMLPFMSIRNGIVDKGFYNLVKNKEAPGLFFDK